jgi:hypothetical protein
LCLQSFEVSIWSEGAAGHVRGGNRLLAAISNRFLHRGAAAAGVEGQEASKTKKVALTWSDIRHDAVKCDTCELRRLFLLSVTASF